jgi:hypothetical protein
LNDFNDLEKRFKSYTYTFKLPNTSLNRALLAQALHPHFYGRWDWLNNVEARITKSGEEVITGVVYIDEISPLEDSIELNIISIPQSFTDLIGDGSIRDVYYEIDNRLSAVTDVTSVNNLFNNSGINGFANNYSTIIPNIPQLWNMTLDNVAGISDVFKIFANQGTYLHPRLDVFNDVTNPIRDLSLINSAKHSVFGVSNSNQAYKDYVARLYDEINPTLLLVTHHPRGRYKWNYEPINYTKELVDGLRITNIPPFLDNRCLQKFNYITQNAPFPQDTKI